MRGRREAEKMEPLQPWGAVVGAGETLVWALRLGLGRSGEPGDHADAQGGGGPQV